MSYYDAYMHRMHLTPSRAIQLCAEESLVEMDDGEFFVSEKSLSSIAIARKKQVESNKKVASIKEEDSTLVNEDNYWIYAVIAHGEPITINTDSITKENWSQHYTAILNILKDGIYTKYVQGYKICIIFHDGTPVNLAIIDYYFNLIMWYSLILSGDFIMPYNIVWEREFRSKFVERFFNEFIIDRYRETASNIGISNICSDTLNYFHDINHFADFLCNTLNLDDSADLMVKDETFKQALSDSYGSLPVDKVEDAIMKNTSISINCIKDAKRYLGYDHCLADAWRANDGINPKQYAEFQIAIGNKPDGKGGIFPVIVDTSFIGGGLNTPMYYFIESSTSRIAQIEKFKNVSKSGTLARIMGLNSMDSYLYPDDKYDCHTRHLVPITVKSADHLRYLDLRWYREFEGGQEKCINYRRDTHLIGKTILLRSPTTCASASRGHGVCYKCYGKLAYSLIDAENGFGVNIGRIASELITSKHTQTQLSVKHILKAVINTIRWCPEFHLIFEMNNNIIIPNSDIDNLSDYRIIINADAIESDNDFSDGGDFDESSEERISGEYDEFVTEFDVYCKSTDMTYHICTEDDTKLYITNELNAVIRHKSEPTDDTIVIPMGSLKDIPLFIIRIQNNEISKIMVKIKNLFNRSNEVRGKRIHELLQELMDTNIEGNMGISAVHYETILMNQIRSADDVLERPNWNHPNPSYRILTLDEALMKNPSITISLSYQKITKSLYTPLTFKKSGASFMDLFFMKKPQLVIRDITEEEAQPAREPGVMYEPISIVDDIDKFTADDLESDGGCIDFEE